MKAGAWTQNFSRPCFAGSLCRLLQYMASVVEVEENPETSADHNKNQNCGKKHSQHVISGRCVKRQAQKKAQMYDHLYDSADRYNPECGHESERRHPYQTKRYER